MVTPDELAEREAVVARLLARVRELEAQAVRDRADIDNLHTALNTARCIGAAVGVVMATNKLTEQAAFELLRHRSQNTNHKLRDIARYVVRTGALPDRDDWGRPGA